MYNDNDRSKGIETTDNVQSKSITTENLKNIKVAFWNIHGVKTTEVRNKLHDPEFLNKISRHDIIGLSELHTPDSVSLPGYTLIKQKIRNEKHKGPKVSGGVAVFARNHLVQIVQLMPNNNIDSIWIKLKTSNHSSDNIFIGTYYVSPENQKNKNDISLFNILNEEVNKFKCKGSIFIMGDFNGRTAMQSDFIQGDKFDDNSEIPLKEPLPRNSEDRKSNARGLDLLDFCKAEDFLIVNGRKSGDIFGKMTSHQYNGSSVVDYLISSNIDQVSDFAVGDFIPWLSDHCPIYCTISLKSPLPSNAQNAQLSEKEPGFTWKHNSKELFESKLETNEVREKLEAFMDDGDLSSQNLAVSIKDTLSEIAKECNLQIKKKKSNGLKTPWFDNECSDLKAEISKYGKLLKNSHGNLELRNKLFLLKKTYKTLIKRKKRAHKTFLINKLTNERLNKQQKEFWKTLEKINPKSDKNSPRVVQADALVTHFKATLTSKHRVILPSDSNERGNLDHHFTPNELKQGCKILKAGKSTGIDNLSNEMLECLVSKYPSLVLKLFNLILDSSNPLPEWSLGMITPIFKKGRKCDPNNYRGIFLLSTFGKLFLSLMNNRLLQYVLENKILSKSQLGFLPGNRTSDAHIIMHNLISKYCHGKSSKIFSCFIDFSKAFDLLPRDILFQKLLGYGINGHFFNTIKHIYENDKACVKLDDKLSKTFDVNQGVRQGCVLSPLLFNIFMADLPKLLEKGGTVEIGHLKLSCLMWADDIVLLCETEDGLRKSLDIVGKYCNENKLTVNTDKTQCMIFNKTGRLIRRKFLLNGRQLELVRSYKYLGFIFTPSGEITTGLKDLKDRALKGFWKLKNSMGNEFIRNISTTITLFDSLIKPIILYAADFWGCLNAPKSNPVDTLHHMVCRQLLRVGKYTANIGVLLELGRVPLHISAVKLSVKNWERIRKGLANEVLLASYAESTTLPWLSGIKSKLETNGMLSFYQDLHADKPTFIYKKIHERLTDNFHQEAFSTIKSQESKLRTYGLIKTEIGFEKYLDEMDNTKTRTVFTKFRISAHRLRIETGRYIKRDKNKKDPCTEKICPFCIDKIESEIHFLLHCPKYELIRALPMRQIRKRIPGFRFYTDIEKFQVLLSKECPEIPKVIEKYMEFRREMLD